MDTSKDRHAKYRQKHKTEIAAYRLSDKGKAAQAKYQQSDKGKAAQAKYRQEHRVKITEYRNTDAYKITRTKYRRKLKSYLRRCLGDMRYRCNNPRATGYKNYGGRGIECRFTDANDFICFVMGVLGYNSMEKLAGLQIDRVNNDEHYEMGNIRFVTAKVNANNRRKKNNMNLFDVIITDRPIIVDGEVMLEAIVPVTDVPWQDSLGRQPLSDIAAQTYGLDKDAEEDKVEDEK